LPAPFLPHFLSQPFVFNVQTNKDRRRMLMPELESLGLLARSKCARVPKSLR
jgi:hypothetical protein